MPMELPALLVEQLPVAALFVLCAVVHTLVAGRERVRRRLVEPLERNTAAWRGACAALVGLEAAVTGRPGAARLRKEVGVP